MKKRLLSLTLIAALCLSLFPTGAAPALADAPSGQVLYVGGVQISSTGYWTTDSAGNVSSTSNAEQPSSGGYIHYNVETNTLTLHNATIKTALEYSDTPPNSFIPGAAIGVLNQSGEAKLTITLEGTNTIAEVGKGIYVLANSTGGATLTITGDGSLDASASQTGIWVQSNNGNAALFIQNAKVEATGTGAAGYGVNVQSSNSSTAALTVAGGSLTASGSPGILYDSIGSGTVPNTTALTISKSAIVDAREGGIGAGYIGNLSGVSPTDDSVGIVFGLDLSDSKAGDVYGNVILQEDLTIGEGETLTIPEGASLNTGSHEVIVNGGTLTGGDKITGTVKYAPTITTESLPNGTVGTAYSQTLAADGSDTITWSVTSGSLPTGLSLSEDGKITGTPTTAETSTFTVTATNAYGFDSKQFTLTIDVSVESVSLDKTTLELTEGSTETLTATITPNNATNQNVTWESSNPSVATVDESGKVTAIAPGTAIITATTADGGKTATCSVTVTEQPSYSITASPAALDFGSIDDDQAAPAAQTVTITNTGNQRVTLTQPTADNYVIGTLSATTLEPNATATFTVQPKADLVPGNYDENILITGSSSASASVATSFTVRERPYIPPTPPSVSEETIDAILDAEPGETVSVALEDGDTTLDAAVFETLAGEDITLEIVLDNGVSWTVNGQDIPEGTNLDDLDLGVEMNSDGIPVDVVNSITGERDTVQMPLAHDGDFGFTMTLTAPLGAENSGYWANLYHYKVNGGEADREDPLGDDEADEQLSYETAARIGDDGSATLPLSHASQYAIVIDDHSHAASELPFTDVRTDDWFYDPVCCVYEMGLMTGVSAAEFAPNTTTTRGMVAAMLHRLEDSPTAENAGFSDVHDGDWYATAVNWAAGVGIVGGFGDGTFQPNAAITREQMASILYRYAAYKGMDVSARATLDGYIDQPSAWAEDVMQWAVAEGLLTGISEDRLQPQGPATRAQVAAIFERFLENIH